MLKLTIVWYEIGRQIPEDKPDPHQSMKGVTRGGKWRTATVGQPSRRWPSSPHSEHRRRWRVPAAPRAALAGMVGHVALLWPSPPQMAQVLSLPIVAALILAGRSPCKVSSYFDSSLDTRMWRVSALGQASGHVK